MSRSLDQNEASCPFFQPPPGGEGPCGCLASYPAVEVGNRYAAAYCAGRQHLACGLYITGRRVARSGEILLRTVDRAPAVVTDPQRAWEIAGRLRPRPYGVEGGDVRPTLPDPASRRWPIPVGRQERARAAGAVVLVLLLAGIFLPGLLGRGDDRRAGEGEIARALPGGTVVPQASSPPRNTPSVAAPVATRAAPTLTAQPVVGTGGPTGLIELYVSTPNGVGLRLRQAPSTTSTAVGLMPYGTRIRAVAEPVRDAAGEEWYVVSYREFSGYAQGRFLSRTRPRR